MNDTGGSPQRSFSYGEIPYDLTFPAMWRHVSTREGDRELMVSLSADGDVERIRYRDADAASFQLARRLVATGVGAGTRVGILAPNGVDFIVAFIAACRIGAVAVPINTFFQARELGWVLRDADIHTLLAVPMLLGQDVFDRIEGAVEGLAGADGSTPLLLASTPALRQVISLGTADRTWLATSSGDDPALDEVVRAMEDAVSLAHDLIVIYTSGSTADPKGILHQHGPAIRHSQFIAAQHEWEPDERVYIPMAFFWVGGIIFGVLGPLQVGVTIVTEHRFEPGPVLHLLADEKVTYATGFPHVGPAIASHPDFATTDLSSIRDGYQPALLPPERRPADPTLRVLQLGMTETCSSHTWWPPGEPVPPEKRGSLGVSGPGYEHKIIDEDGNDVPLGEVGEICVRGDALMRGMVGRTRDQILDREGWYHTGDSGRFDADGHLYFGGRTDDMIKTSGANVAPIEVEGVLNAFDDVQVSYVIGVPDPHKGAVVAAAVVQVPGASTTPADLTARCREVLAAYKVPKRWLLLPDADALPYTTTNKIDKRRLVELIESGELVAMG